MGAGVRWPSEARSQNFVPLNFNAPSKGQTSEHGQKLTMRQEVTDGS